MTRGMISAMCQVYIKRGSESGGGNLMEKSSQKGKKQGEKGGEKERKEGEERERERMRGRKINSFVL